MLPLLQMKNRKIALIIYTFINLSSILGLVIENRFLNFSCRIINGFTNVKNNKIRIKINKIIYLIIIIFYLFIELYLYIFAFMGINMDPDIQKV